MGVKIRNRHRLRNKEIRKLLSELENIFDYSLFDEKASVETGEYEGSKIVLVDGQPYFTYFEDRLFFTLHGLNKYNPQNYFVVVDMGAVKFVTSGADVMAPGIIDADNEIKENDLVWICDEKHHKPLAVGIAVMNGEQMINEKKGKAISVFHHVGDRLWNFPHKGL